MARIRVLQVIARMNVGGPALVVSGLMERLDPDVFDVRLVTGYVEEGEADYLDLRAPTLPVTRIDGLGRSIRPAADVGALVSLVREVRRFRPDVVHTHTAKAGVLGRLAARAGRVPVTVHTFHGHLLSGYFSPRMTSAVIATERLLARSTTRLVAVGAQVAEDLLEVGIGTREKYVVVPPGVSLPPMPDRATARTELGLPDDATVVAFVARLTAIKRPDRLLAVAAAVGETHPEAVFVVVGEGPLLDQLRDDAAHLGDRVRFLGWRADVERIYAAADLVLLTSDNEGMPVSLIEAALCGVPAVTTEVGSAGEVVLDGVTGLVVPATEVALTAAVDRLLGDEDLRVRMGAAAAEHAERAFGVGHLADRTGRLYLEALGRSGGGPAPAG